MAVRHGYGKAAGTDALVFAYDTGDTRNSYKGEPTTNLATDTPSQSGWQGTYSVVDSNTKTFLITTQQNDASVGAAWRTWYWSVSSYIGSYITISADVEFVSETNCTFSNITVGQGNTGTYPTHILGSDAADRQTISTKPVEKIHMTWSGVINATGIVGFTFWTSNVTVNGATAVLRISNVQIEAKAHETPFVNGTRSSTQGLLDLTGNSSINLTNAGFDSNAQLDFDGTNTYIPKFTDSRFQFADTDLTYEVVVNFNSNPNSYQTLIGLADTNDYIPRINLSKARSGLDMTGVLGPVYMQLIDQNGSGATVRDPDLSGIDLVAGGYYHYVGIVSKPAGSSTYSVYLYRNGVLVSSTDSGKTTYDTTQGVQGSIGLAVGTQFGNTASVLDGQLPVAKVYNRALTAGEVLNNFNNYKSRFNL